MIIFSDEITLAASPTSSLGHYTSTRRFKFDKGSGGCINSRAIMTITKIWWLLRYLVDDLTLVICTITFFCWFPLKKLLICVKKLVIWDEIWYSEIKFGYFVCIGDVVLLVVA